MLLTFRNNLGRRKYSKHLQQRKMIDFQGKKSKFLSEVDFSLFDFEIHSARSRSSGIVMRSGFERFLLSEHSLEIWSQFWEISRGILGFSLI